MGKVCDELVNPTHRLDGVSMAAGRTHPGRVRTSNEDAFVADSALNLYVVADGMGGYRGGEVASEIAVRVVHEFVRASRNDQAITWPYGFETNQSFEANQLRNGICLAHRQIRAEGSRTTDLQDMGSTIVTAIVSDRRLTAANVGDSRLYLLRAGSLRQLSEDHSWAAAAVRSGADPAAIKSHPMSHLLTSALGSDQPLDVPIHDAPLEDGDVLLLCSDGLYRAVRDDAIAEILSERGWDVDARADRLVELANEAGGPDNITAVVARYQADAMAPDGAQC